jgi:BirA family biotin operon repressor/biotin-[acetyl-CoA-carboxylase] ligase
MNNFSQYYITSGIHFDAKRFQTALKTKYIGRSFIYREETESTMNIAQRETHEGAATGTLILAERQTSGRGRKGREWVSETGGNLYFTIVIRVNPQEPLHLLKLNFALAAAIVQACRDEGVQETYIKWPNDVWVKTNDSYSKVCGMLIDSIQTQEDLSANCGVGLNVNQDMTKMKERIVGNIPTSLFNELRSKVDREQLLAKICNALETLLGGSLESVLEVYKGYDILVGKQVTVTSGTNEPRFGKAKGYSKFGNLIVKFDDGEEKELLAEEVSIRTVKTVCNFYVTSLFLQTMAVDITKDFLQLTAGKKKTIEITSKRKRRPTTESPFIKSATDIVSFYSQKQLTM